MIKIFSIFFEICLEMTKRTVSVCIRGLETLAISGSRPRPSGDSLYSKTGFSIPHFTLGFEEGCTREGRRTSDRVVSNLFEALFHALRTAGKDHKNNLTIRRYV